MNDLASTPHSPLHRAGQERLDPGMLASLFTLPSSRLVVIDPQGHHHIVGSAGHFDQRRHVHLGWTDDAAVEGPEPGRRQWFAIRGASDGPALREATLTQTLREVVTTAAAVLAWHDGEPPCEVCGGPTVPVRGGFVRQCESCGAWLFPRQDPAIIIALTNRDDQLLLAHQASWAPGRVSVLAGFVEAGETLEQACGREVLEEVGLRVDQVAYVGSQPWPFPRSLMLGFVGRADGHPVPDGVEIAWARWFEREELTRSLASGELSLPGPASVGGRLVRQWLEGTLDQLR